MALTDLLKNVGRALTLTAALYSCGGKETTVYPCRTDADCTSGTCVSGYCESPNQGNGDCTPIQYIWGVGNCEGSSATNQLVPADFEGVCREDLPQHGFIRNFSLQDVDSDSRCNRRYDNYRCALEMNPNLYVLKITDRPLCLSDNLYLLANMPNPALADCNQENQCAPDGAGQEECRRITQEQGWYDQCFTDRGAEP